MTPHPAALLGLLIAAAQPACPSLPSLGPLVCIEDVSGFVYARDEASARTMVKDAHAAREIYRTHFGRLPPRGAIVSAGTQVSVGAAERATLRAAGAQWVLPWIDAADRNRVLEPKIRAGIEQQMPNLSPEAVDAAVKRALASIDGEGGGGDTSMRSAMQHELGHLWMIADRWPRFGDEEAAGRAGRHYGGPAADWFDETAAVLMEDAAMTAGRRALFGAIRRGEHPGEQVAAIAEFVTMEHPAIAHVRARPDPKPGASVMVLAGEDARRVAAGAKAFYAQARVFADYLIERSGRADVFAAIADAAAEGRDFASWLGRDGAHYGLPATLPALELDWQAWVAPAYPAEA